MKTINEMLNSKEFEVFISDRLGNDLFLSDPERADRVHKYAEDGADGSTHAEVIDDWRCFLRSLRVVDEDGTGDISEDDFNALNADIDDCERWHEKNGSLNKIIN